MLPSTYTTVMSVVLVINDTMLSVLAQHGFIDVLSQLFYAMCKMSRSSIILQYDNIRVCMVCM